MRNLSQIWDVWLSGAPKIGASRPNSVLTVEKDWYLTKTGRKIGKSKRGPFRWWQNDDNDQVETEIPNLKSINIDRSIETDAASCSIEIYNTSLDADDVPPAAVAQRVGAAGWFTWARGKSSDSLARWNQETNEWEDVITPNALLRTYQGYGGHDKAWSDARDDGDIALTGAWLVDSVEIGVTGVIRLRCRDMAKLLIEQQLYKPLVPDKEYPLKWCRWYYKEFDASFDPRPAPTPPGGPANTVGLTYKWSSGDAWYGFNSTLHGHTPTDSLDGNTETFALSVGNSHPSRSFCADYFEYQPSGPVDNIYIHPWGGNYEMYISIKENGRWVTGSDAGNIEYDHTPLCATQTCIDTGTDVPYVLRTGTGWETGQWHRLPRQFNAERIRITFRNHTQSPWGPWYYRCGIREIRAGYGAVATNSGTATVPWVFSIDHHPTGAGYWCVDESGRVFAFGDCREHTKTGGGAHDAYAVTIISTESGEGYWVLLENGRVQSYGDADHFGDAANQATDFIDMARTPSGDGYWLVRRDGTVHEFGDATNHGDMPYLPGLRDPASYTATGIESHPSTDGYWICNGKGQVRGFGSLSSLGSVSSGLTGNEWVRGFKRNAAGDGYWLLGGSGRVWSFGAASHHGNFSDGISAFSESEESAFRKLLWQIAPNPDGTGYGLQHADGTITFLGDFDFYGNPGGMGTIRLPGNYEDYTDIVKHLLLWSGWLFKSDSYDADEEPPVYGNMENTGAWAEECLPEEEFDKKNVIDAINVIKEIVGYLFWIDDEGAAHFESPNWWGIGNFYEDGSQTDFIPELDQDTVLTDYRINFTDQDARSQIIIGTEFPEQAGKTTVSTKYTPGTADVLRGMVKPAMWINGMFGDRKEQRIMAELIAMHIWFSMRTGSVTALANPAIQINDQVRIFEEQTAETYIHYVRGMSTTHDLDSGRYEMTLDTHWLGDYDEWVITRNAIPDDGDLARQIRISQALMDWLENMESQSVEIARLRGFVHDSELEATTKTADAAIPDGAPGAADG